MRGTEAARAHEENRCVQFTTTHWSAVVAAGQATSPEATSALEALCRRYWYPLYAHVRRRGFDPHEAQDLTQAFFEQLLSGSFFRAADPNKGRFRTFLLTALDHFLANQWRRGQTLKRGRGHELISLDEDSGENRYQLEPAHDETPERLFLRRWALAVLDEAMNRLGNECGASGRRAVFEALKPLIGGDRADVPHAELAARLSVSENAVNLALMRLRRRYGELIREAIAETVANPSEVDEELRCLKDAIRQ